MAIRATGAQIRLITGSTALDAALVPFITAANALVEQAIASGCAASLSEPILLSAENFLASHLFAQSAVGTSSNAVTRERFENYEVTYAEASKGMNNLSGYGATANALMNGCLSEIGKTKATIEFF